MIEKMQTKMNRICFIIDSFLIIDFRSANVRLFIPISKLNFWGQLF